MIIGIISLIMLIIGFTLICYGGKKEDGFYILIGFILFFISMIGLLIFGYVNEKTIIDWFKI